MPRPTTRTFSPGFRLSAVDVGILVAGAIGAVALGRLDPWAGVAVAFVVGHFFLFCNVLRMSRPPELVWAVAFAGMAVTAVVFGAVSWPAVFAGSATLTVVLVVIECRRPSYHGVGWRRLNPRLPAWWASRAGDGVRPTTVE